jgi:hypothetical protein
MLTTDQKGAIAETAITAAAIKLGVGVFKPLAVERYDLVFDLRPKLVRVQCKWAAFRGSVVVVRCCPNRRGRDGVVRRPYTPGEIDAIAAYCYEFDRCYFFPFDRLPRRSAIQLRLEPTLNDQERGILWAETFEFAVTLRREGP